MHASHRSNERLAMAAALLSNLLLGASVAASRYVIAYTDFVTLAFLRYGIAAALLGAVLWRVRPELPPRRDLLLLAALGILIFGLFPLSYNAAVQYTLATRAAMMFALVPLLTLGFAVLLRFEALTGRKILGGLLALLGVLLALGDPHALLAAPSTVWRGDFFMLLTVCMGSLYNVLARGPLHRNTPLNGFAYSLFAGTLFLVCVLGAGALLRSASPPWPPPTFAVWGTIAFIAIGGVALGYGLFLWALKHVAASRVAIFVPLSPIAAASIATWALGEPVSLGLISGLVLVTAGIVLVNWSAVRRSSGARPSA